MIKDFENKERLAKMQSQLKEAAKQSDRDARIQFVLMHLICEYQELADSIGKQEEGNLFHFTGWCLNEYANNLESKSHKGFTNPIELFQKEGVSLPDLFTHAVPVKDAVERGLDESQEWPEVVPYEEWKEDMLLTAYATMFGLYYFDTPSEDLVRWLGEDEPDNEKFVNAMNRHITAVNIVLYRAHQFDDEKSKERKKVDVDDEDLKKGFEELDVWRKSFAKLANKIAEGDTKRFCLEKPEAAFGVFIAGLYTMMLPDESYSRSVMTSSKDNARFTYEIAKKTTIGEDTIKAIVTAEDDEAAFEIFCWALVGGEGGVSEGILPTGLIDYDL